MEKFEADQMHRDSLQALQLSGQFLHSGSHLASCILSSLSFASISVAASLWLPNGGLSVGCLARLKARRPVFSPTMQGLRVGSALSYQLGSNTGQSVRLPWTARKTQNETSFDNIASSNIGPGHSDIVLLPLKLK